MPATKFPWLSDIEPRILAKIDQRRSVPGQRGIDRAEISDAFNAEHKYLFERISSMDKGFSLTIDDTVTTDGTNVTALPAGIRALRAVYILTSGKPSRLIDIGAWHELGAGSCNREALYRAYPEAELYWLKAPESGLTLRAVYDRYPAHLFHGCVLDASGSVIQVESHEPIEDSVGLDRNILVYEGPGIGQERTVSAYSGSTREITVSSAFTTLPTSRSRITSRPDLPPDAYEAFFYGVCARLVEKFRDARFQEYTAQRAEKLSAMNTALATLDRRGPMITYDMDTFGHGDPVDSYGL